MIGRLRQLSEPRLRQQAGIEKSQTPVERDILVQWVRKSMLSTCTEIIDELCGQTMNHLSYSTVSSGDLVRCGVQICVSGKCATRVINLNFGQTSLKSGQRFLRRMLGMTIFSSGADYSNHPARPTC